jgi:hypothetical protein
LLQIPDLIIVTNSIRIADLLHSPGCPWTRDWNTEGTWQISVAPRLHDE